MYKLNKKNGFTLLEVLIASAMFALVMLITTATVASSSSYQVKLKNMKETAEETRRLADKITNDVRSANTLLTITISVSGVPTTKEFKNGLALLNCKATCTFINNTASSINIGDGNPFPANGSDNINANTLVISTKDGIKVFINSTDNKTIYYALLSGSSIANANIILSIRNTDNAINSPLNETAINFGGYCPDDNSIKYFQPYIHFFITSRTKDYVNLGNNQRAKAQIKSTVTSRSYNQ